jgi:anaerobic selenocysteine-containing dehydrogenase
MRNGAARPNSRQNTGMAADREVVLTTCPRDCYDACGIRVVKHNGTITAVRGDPAHAVARGWLCPKCATGYNGSWRDEAKRLTRPLRRSGKKGSGSFTPITWDAALDEVAQRLKQTVASTGAHTVLNTHYSGTMSLLGYYFPMRFFNRLGATEVDPDTICNKAGHVALEYVYGTSTDGFDPRTAKDAACILVWGANPSTSAPHAHRHWLAEAPGQVIVVDPIRTPTAEKAYLHLQPFPGSDAALAFALMHVIEREDLVDKEFVRSHTVGWEDLAPLVTDCTPEWGESVTGVPADQIVAAARLYGRGPSLLWLGQGLQRQRTGGNVMRACALLPAITGNLGKPGAGFLYLNGGANRRIDEGYVMGGDLGGEKPASISQMEMADHLEDPGRSQALMCWNINIAASNPQQRRLHKALEREDLFTVVVDVFPTDTTDFADIILPAASFLEFDDLVISYFNLTVGAQVKATEPMGECLPNTEIFRRLAKKMDFAEPELYESDADVIDTVLRKAEIGEDFRSLAAKGSVFVSSEPIIQFDGLKFPTPSGRVEIASARAEADGFPRAPRPTVDARPTNNALRLLSPASSWLMNDSFANDPGVAKRLGPVRVSLHPADAAARGLAEGDEVVLSNGTGRLSMIVTVSDAIPRGVAVSPKGRWPKLEETDGNVNRLNPGEQSDMGRSTAVHGVEVMIARRTDADRPDRA